VILLRSSYVTQLGGAEVTGDLRLVLCTFPEVSLQLHDEVECNFGGVAYFVKECQKFVTRDEGLANGRAGNCW
jgi:hypothetical protein